MSGAFYLRLNQRRVAKPQDASHATPLDRDMMERALLLAAKAAAIGEVPVGAIVYETASGKMLGQGFNTREKSHNPLAHAEQLAILEAARNIGDWRLDACTLVVTLEPCAMCAGAIVNARVGRVVFGAMDPKAGFAGSLGNLLEDERLNHRVKAIAGVCGEECGAVLKKFFGSRREEKRAERARGRRE